MKRSLLFSYFCFWSLISLNSHDNAQGIKPKVCSFSSRPIIVFVFPKRSMDRNKVRSIGIYKYKVLKNTTSKYFCSKSGEGTGAEMSPAIVSGIATADALVSYWPFFPNHSNGPRSLCEPLRCLVSFSLLKWQKPRV